MADPKKMRLTFLWADRAAVEMDFGQGYSKTLVDWASAFYKPYGLELDVAPKPGDREAAYANVLAGGTDGYEPDMVTAEEYIKRYAEARRPTEEAKQRADRKFNESFDRAVQKQREMDAEIGRFGSLSPIDWPAQVLKVAALFDELQAARAQNDLDVQEWGDQVRALRRIDQEFEMEQSFRDYDTPARLAIGDKVVRSLVEEGRDRARRDRGPATGDKANIWSESRLKVLFCRFRLSPGMQKPDAPRHQQPYGVTTGRVAPNSVNGQYMFGGPIIFINVLRPDRITLAHEMVHAAGRLHRPDFDRLKDLDRLLEELKRNWQSSAKGKPFVLPTFFERVWGGEYDGPPDDIINYHSKSKDPDKVKLYDRPLFDGAFFVKTP